MPSSETWIKWQIESWLMLCSRPLHFRKSLEKEMPMQFLLAAVSVIVAMIATSPSRALERSELVMVRAVIDGDTIDVTRFGRVRLLGIDAPEIGRVFDTSAPFAVAARDKLAALVLR